MTQNLKEFLNQEDIQEALASYNFKYIYEQLDKLSNQWEYIPKFTELMLSVGYNPLDYMDYVPAQYLFSGHIKEIEIPNHIKSIGMYAFKGCKNLTKVEIPNQVMRIEDGTFKDCSNLVDVTIPDNITHIGTGAFFNCNHLTSVTIGKNVKKINSDAFRRCPNLKTVCYQGTEEEWKKIKISKNGNTRLLNTNIIFKG